MALGKIRWQVADLISPNLETPTKAVVARDLPYVPSAKRLQNLSIYLPYTSESERLVGQPATSLPGSESTPLLRYHVHVHGGAWRDPFLNSSSIEAAAAHAFASPQQTLTAIASINYTLSPFPTHPTLPYDPSKGDSGDPGREAIHPGHIYDVLRAFTLLRSLGLTDDSYILSGHSCGACLAFQAALGSPEDWGFTGLSGPPRPAALVGMNGLYDLPNLVDGLGASHESLRGVYDNLIRIAFGNDTGKWPPASPARVNQTQLAGRVTEGVSPKMVILDQSTEDQLVPMNQTEALEKHLKAVPGMTVRRGYRCTGVHAAPWEQGYMIWETVQDAIKLATDQ